MAQRQSVLQGRQVTRENYLTQPIIQIENLGKSYLVGHNRSERYTALRDVIGREAKALARKAADLVRGRQIIEGDEVEEFWALQDVSFAVQPGEVVGIIGRNGAGKSTLLKVLSRITEPTRGRVTLRGRIASLLEVGTGFHPELTGRENIYLNGAILGMARAEIARKFDEIVAFAEIDKFLDTPVKRYSSGMYVRLAFAVAAHLEPEILAVDEVLAVGDIEFQRKCLGKIHNVAGQGRTVLFVSHNMAAVRQLCTRCILLDKGRVIAAAPTDEIIQKYIESGPTGTASLQGAVALDETLSLTSLTVSERNIQSFESLTLNCEFAALSTGQILELAFNFYTAGGLKVGVVDLRELVNFPIVHQAGSINLSVEVPEIPLVEGDYSVGLWVRTRHYTGFTAELAAFTISPTCSELDFIPYAAELRGVVAMRARTLNFRES